MINRPRRPQKPPEKPAAQHAIKGPSKAPQRVIDSPSVAPPGAEDAALARARSRLDAVVASRRLAATGTSQAGADREAARHAGVTPDTVRRWRLACKGLSPDARLAVLADRPGRGRCGPLTDAEMRGCVEALIQAHGPHLTARHVERVLRARCRPCRTLTDTGRGGHRHSATAPRAWMRPTRSGRWTARRRT